MTPYIFKGLIHPERATLSFGAISFSYLNPTTNKKSEGKLNIVLNQVTVWIYTEDEWDIYDLRNAVKQTVNDLVSIIGFLKGYAYDVEIRQVLNDDRGIDLVFGINIPCLEERNKDVKIKDKIIAILKKASEEHGIFIHRSLNDLTMAMQHPQDTGFYCFRAIESLRHYCRVKFNIESESDQWKKVNSVTGFDKDYIEIIRKFALPTRHGDIVPISSDNRAELFTKTWDVIEAFIEKAIAFQRRRTVNHAPSLSTH